ncbi:hypothetical protein BV392_18530 [Rhodovulum sulfidophilum]|nr:hypothetical protein BV392_18530 [Rhodovulum sulfidophilum]
MLTTSTPPISNPNPFARINHTGAVMQKSFQKNGMTLATRIYWRIAGRFNQVRAGRARAAARVFEARAEKFLARFKGGRT